jgi:hypothetical protein
LPGFSFASACILAGGLYPSGHRFSCLFCLG